MFEKKKLVVAVGAAFLSIISASAIAECAAPSIDTPAVAAGVLYGPVGGTVQGSSDVCNTNLTGVLEITNNAGVVLPTGSGSWVGGNIEHRGPGPEYSPSSTFKSYPTMAEYLAAYLAGLNQYLDPVDTDYLAAKLAGANFYMTYGIGSVDTTQTLGGAMKGKFSRTITCHDIPSQVPGFCANSANGIFPLTNEEGFHYAIDPADWVENGDPDPLYVAPPAPPVATIDLGAITAGQSFSKSFSTENLPVGNYTATVKIKSGSTVLSTSTQVFTVAAPTMPTMPTLADPLPVSEAGGTAWTFEIPAGTNCPITNDETVAKANRALNYCLVEVTHNGTPFSVSAAGVVTAPAGTSGATAALDWKISKIDASNAKISLAAGVQNITYTAIPTTFDLALPASMVATHDYTATMAEAGAKLATTKAAAQAYAVLGERSYWVDFTNLPKGLVATETDGSIVVAGKLMVAGNLNAAYSPKRVLADGSVTAMGAKSVAITATLPASGVTAPASATVDRDVSMTLTPSTSTGACDTLSGNPLVAAGATCLFTWTPVDTLTQNGISLEGIPSLTGTINAAWKVEYLDGANVLELNSGTSAIEVTEPFACPAPAINTLTIPAGVQYGPLAGIAQGTLEACQTGLMAVVDIVDNNDAPIVTLDLGAISAGAAFTRTFMQENLAVGSYTAIFQIKNVSDVVLSSSSKSFIVATPTLATMPVLADPLPVSEVGGTAWTFGIPAGTNCPITNSEVTARGNRAANYCLIEVTNNGVPLTVTSGGAVIAPAGVPGSTAALNWSISKIDANSAKVPLASGVQNIEYAAIEGVFSLSLPTDMVATHSYTATMSESGAKLATTQSAAQAFAVAGSRAYWIDFTSLPAGIVATESAGNLLVSGKLMASGSLSIAYTPKRVMADGSVSPLSEKTIAIAAIKPASGVTVPATATIGRYGNLSVAPMVHNGACESLTPDLSAAADAVCLFTWTDLGGMTQNGVKLEGAPSVVGKINAAWKVEYVVGAEKLEINSGTSVITVSDSVLPIGTLASNSNVKALTGTSYQFKTPGCTPSTDNTEVGALAQSLATGEARCFVTSSLPADFLLSGATVTGDTFAYAGVFKAMGSKSVSFTPKKAMPDGTVLAGVAVQGLTTVADHGLSFSAKAPTRVRAPLTTEVSVQSIGAATCVLTSNVNAVNTLTTLPAERECITTFTGPENWVATPDSIGGAMPATGDVTVGWQITLPIEVAGVVQKIAISQGSKTISGYTPEAPAFTLSAKVLGDAILGTNGKGELGNINVTTASSGLSMTVKVIDSTGSELISIPSIGAKAPKSIKIASLGTSPLFTPQTIKVRVAYAGTDSDVFTEKELQVIRLPDVAPSIKVITPKRAKAGTTASVSVQLGEVSRSVFSYDANRLGPWKVRLAKINADKSLTYLTEAQSVTAADGSLSIDLLADASWIGSSMTVVASLDTTLPLAAKSYSTTSFRINEYVWPAFDMEVRQPAAFAPSDVHLRLTTTDKRFASQANETGSKATYTWDLPDGVTVVKTDGSSIYVNMNQAGQYEIGLTVSDPTGSSSKITKTIQVAEPAPFNVNVKMYSANKWPGRAPAAFALRPEVIGGHPLDRIANYKMTIDGEEVHNSARAPRVLSLPDAGQHSVGMVITSKMGATGTFAKDITLAENQAPTCVLTKKSSRGTGSVNAVCSDVDGKIVSYAWTIDGVQKTANRNFYSFPILAGGSSVEMTATDDVGATATASTTVSP